MMPLTINPAPLTINAAISLAPASFFGNSLW
jgi:hypothetical protein